MGRGKLTTCPFRLHPYRSMCCMPGLCHPLGSQSADSRTVVDVLFSLHKARRTLIDLLSLRRFNIHNRDTRCVRIILSSSAAGDNTMTYTFEAGEQNEVIYDFDIGSGHEMYISVYWT
jgi:hypothetical protein